jgi:predicted nucleotidyltransferase
MIQKCSIIAVLEIFFKEPLKAHFIREISRRINLAQTSVRNNIKELIKNKLIIEKKSYPFNNLIANRDNEKFLFYKQAYNYYSLFDLKNEIIDKIHPKGIVIFGSYSRGEDIEESDIDVLIISKIKKDLDLSNIEDRLNRKINLLFVNSLKELDKNIKNNVQNGWVIYGGINE